MRVVRSSSDELKYIDKRHIVAPESAVFLIGFAGSYGSVQGLEEMRRSIYACTDQDIREALRHGDWLLIDEQPPSTGSVPLVTHVESPPSRPLSKQPAPLQRKPQAIIFAKSCTPRGWGKAEAGTEIEPAEHFGRIMVAKSKPIPAEAAALTALVGADAVLGRLAGGGIQQRGYVWALRGVAAAAGPFAAFVAGMLPSTMGDGTLYADDELRAMDAAASRVRFQFRYDPEGQLQLYGIHTGSKGDDTVPVVHAYWKDKQRTLQADLGEGISIIWTPNSGPLRTPELVYPQPGDERLGAILVHPIAPDTDSQIEVYPEVDEITLGDRIITFPAESGLSSLYVVYSKPLPPGHSYHKPPRILDAFPDAMPSRSKSSVQGGGKQRTRWKDRKGRIYEWDGQHGTVELYDKQGKHLGEFNPTTGLQTKPPDPRRRVEK